MARHYGQQPLNETGSGDYSSEGTLANGRALSDMADFDVSESKLRGLDVVGASAGAIMLLGPLAAVAIGIS